MVKLLTAEIARELLNYDPETGHITRKKSDHYWCVGKVIGTPSAKGYLTAWVYDGVYQLHRVAWLMAHGYWPVEQLDHINHIRNDNRRVNLRECTNAENRQNIRPEGYGASGYLGVYPRANGMWMAKIILNGKMRYLGLFDTAEAADEAYRAAKEQVHVFATTGVSQLMESST